MNTQTKSYKLPVRTQHATVLRSGMFIVVCIALAKFALHLYFNNRYGYFRDEFDYIACGQHLAWGYVDQPPLIPALVRLTQEIFGNSLRSIRLVPALASSALVVLTALIAREFGGRRFALVLSAIAVLIAPMYLSDGSLLTTNCLEPLLWMGCVYFIILAINRGDPRYWLWFGVVAGIGAEEKYSIGVLGFGIVVGLLLTDKRKYLWNKWLWLGGLAAFLIFLPNLLWNIHYHWPFLQLIHNIRASGRDIQVSPWEYFVQQNVLLDPINAPLWIGGVLALFFWKPLRDYRMFGWCYLACFAAFAFMHGKIYYLAPVYPMLLAAGAGAVDRAIDYMRQAWLKPALALVFIAIGAWFAPLVIPVFSIEHFITYMHQLPIKIPKTENNQIGAVLPQYYADQFGWKEMAADVAEVYKSLPPEERAKTAIIGNNYGESGAIDFFGPKYGLPKSIGVHQSYWLWGPRNYTGESMIVLGDNRESLASKCASIQEFDFVYSPYAMEHNPIFVCHGLKWNLQEIWPKLKKWN
jgi:hypothetical protein